MQATQSLVEELKNQEGGDDLNSREYLLALESEMQKWNALRKRVSEAAADLSNLNEILEPEAESSAPTIGASTSESETDYVVDEFLSRMQQGEDPIVLLDKFNEYVTGIHGEIARNKKKAKDYQKRLDEISNILDMLAMNLNNQLDPQILALQQKLALQQQTTQTAQRNTADIINLNQRLAQQRNSLMVNERVNAAKTALDAMQQVLASQRMQQQQQSQQRQQQAQQQQTVSRQQALQVQEVVQQQTQIASRQQALQTLEVALQRNQVAMESLRRASDSVKASIDQISKLQQTSGVQKTLEALQKSLDSINQLSKSLTDRNASLQTQQEAVRQNALTLNMQRVKTIEAVGVQSQQAALQMLEAIRNQFRASEAARTRQAAVLSGNPSQRAAMDDVIARSTRAMRENVTKEIQKGLPPEIQNKAAADAKILAEQKAKLAQDLDKNTEKLKKDIATAKDPSKLTPEEKGKTALDAKTAAELKAKEGAKQQETAKQEAAKQEAAKQEVAKQEAAKKAAAEEAAKKAAAEKAAQRETQLKEAKEQAAKQRETEKLDSQVRDGQKDAQHRIKDIIESGIKPTGEVAKGVCGGCPGGAACSTCFVTAWRQGVASGQFRPPTDVAGLNNMRQQQATTAGRGA